jgi:leader peptidase (prepilin peptidase) / N-methyltransferase
VRAPALASHRGDGNWAARRLTKAPSDAARGGSLRRLTETSSPVLRHELRSLGRSVLRSASMSKSGSGAGQSGSKVRPRAQRTSPAELVAVLRDPAPLLSTILVAAVLFLVLFTRADASARTWALIPLLAALATIAALDAAARLIPDLLTFPGLAYAVLLAAIFPEPSFGRVFLGIVLAGGLTLLVAIARRQPFGGGDVKLMAMLGAALGWEGALTALLIGYVVGAVVIVALLVSRRRWPQGYFPIGACIALSGAVILAARG